jgi:hypothetical protein
MYIATFPPKKSQFEMIPIGRSFLAAWTPQPSPAAIPVFKSRRTGSILISAARSISRCVTVNLSRIA